MTGHTKRGCRLSAQAGFGLVEVMVTAVVVVLVATATVTSISESQHTTARTLARGITANLAEQDQERMRGMRAKDLADYKATRTVLQQGVSYTVESRGEFVQDASGDVVTCTSTGSQTSYLRLSSTVTPAPGFRADPLTMRSLMPLPVTQYSPTSGSLIAPLVDAKGAPLSGVSVALGGPESRAATTNSDGCAIFQFLTPGAYTITLNQAGYVDTTLAQKLVYSGTVTPANVNTATPQVYDLAGAIAPKYDTANTTNAAGITLVHAGLTGTGGTTRTFGTGGAAPLFPFTSPYAVYSGSCAANDPSAAANDGPTFYTDLAKYGDPATGKAKPFGQALVQGTSPATTTAVDLHEPPVAPKINVNGAALSSAIGNSGRVYFKSLDGAACQLPGTPNVPNAGGVNTTAAAGSPAIRLPYGKYKACAEFNKTAGSGTNGTYSTVFNGPIDNTKFGPPTTALSSPVINIDTTNTANKVSCAGRGAW